MNPKTIRLFAALGAVGLALAAGVGWLLFDSHPPKPPAPPVTSAAPASFPAPIPSPEPPATRGSTAPASGQRYALLVGVGAYQHADNKLRNLAGPPEDVRAMAQVLGDRWGFGTITVLQDAEATRANVLQKLDDLVRVTEPGSHVLFYFSGHGTSRQDPKSGLPLPHTSGALVAYDSNLGAASKTEDIIDSLIVGSRDLRPRFETLDRKGVYLTAWLDACFSENSSYSSASSTGSRRYTPLPPMDFGEDSVAYQPYPYRNAVTFAASAANQTAQDIDQREIGRFPTLDGAYHGAFSDALLRALTDRALPGYGALDKNADGVVAVEELYGGVASFMRERGYDHSPKLQPIQAEDAGGGRNRALFHADGQFQAAAPAAVAAPTRPPALRVAFAGPPDARGPLASLPGLELVTTGAELTVAARTGGYSLRDANGAMIGDVPNLAALKEALRRRAVLNRLLAAARQAGRATVGLELASAYATTRLPLGDREHPVRVSLRLKADRDGYPVVLDLFGDGVVRRLYPWTKDEEYNARWAAKQSKPLLCIETEPPTGIDAIYAFVLDRPLPADLVRDAERIDPANGGGFDAILDQLSQPGRVLGADRLPLEIYPAQPDELQGWREKGCEP